MYKNMPLPEEKDLKNFGFIGSVIFPLISGIAFWRHPGELGFKHYIGLLVFVFLPLALFSPRHLMAIYKGMMYIAMPIGFVVFRVISLILLVCVFFPLRLVSGLGGKDKMNRKLDKSAPSYWMDAEYPTAKPEEYPNWY